MPDLSQVHYTCKVGKCEWHDQMTPPKDRAALRVIQCPKHGLKHIAITGYLAGRVADDDSVFDVVEGELEKLAVIPSKNTAVRLTGSDLWHHFCAVLDASRPIRAGGNPDNRACHACDEHTSHMIKGCQCPCHVAWAYREGMERGAKAA